MLCPLCALDPLQGPHTLIETNDLVPISEEMASEIVSYGEVSLSLAELTYILSSALTLTLPPPERPWNYNLAPKLPDGISDWEDDAVIGIGYFDQEGHLGPIEVNGRCRSGIDVETRRLGDFDGYGYFYAFVIEDEDEEEREESWYTCCSSVCGWPFFVLRTCLEYLRVWLDPHLPPRIAFMDSAPTMSLEGELYEILNTRIEERGKRSNVHVGC